MRCLVIDFQDVTHAPLSAADEKGWQKSAGARWHRWSPGRPTTSCADAAWIQHDIGIQPATILRGTSATWQHDVDSSNRQHAGTLRQIMVVCSQHGHQEVRQGKRRWRQRLPNKAPPHLHRREARRSQTVAARPRIPSPRLQKHETQREQRRLIHNETAEELQQHTQRLSTQHAVAHPDKQGRHVMQEPTTQYVKIYQKN